MGFLQLLVVAVLASEHRVAGAAEVFGNSSEGLIEFSVGKFRYFELNRPFPEEAILHDISSNVTFLIFQIHSQYQNTTVSFSPTLLSNSSETGTASGLVFILRPEQSTCTWYLGTSGIQPVQNMAILLSYSERDPVPGGCNLEFDLDIDPNIYLEYNFFETTIKFAPANLGYARGVDPPPCDAGTDQDSRWRLQYDVYQYFLPENDLTEEMLLKHLQRMVSVPQVKASALKLCCTCFSASPPHHPPLSLDYFKANPWSSCYSQIFQKSVFQSVLHSFCPAWFLHLFLWTQILENRIILHRLYHHGILLLYTDYKTDTYQV
ncbi:transmembrane 7 superfamily member 3 isoform X8 [Homo sapiens]|uniref:transmembrane 7 superfamily member 3 isoform X8 n=1 Tax=Homo sapiens TaxID=9606 RepID=UPI0005D013EE|nr:transmembrane 7 superfamily member 3 isoform X8 [Homo sapiens]XP_054228242.1 transmembrane 7 superfamily member 3 isoform X8 [Homo sapiens]|eukprot:XP_011518993.1 transmembrane 7 superfamily member 3 isoform X7 [Homo sapiens]